MSDSTLASDEVLCQILEELRAIRGHLETIDETLHTAVNTMERAFRVDVVHSIPSGIGSYIAPIELSVRSIQRELCGNTSEGEPSVRTLLQQIAASLSVRRR